jgi:hypothetical protein
MVLDPRTADIPEALLDFLGEARAIVWKVLPCSDDGSTLTLYCPNHPMHGDYGAKTANLFGRELGRTIEFIPVEYDKLMQAIHQQFASIKNCPPEFSFQCPKTWQSLELTNTETVRFCTACQKNVYWCETPAEVQAHAQQDQCIAVLSAIYLRSFPSEELLVGRI